MECLVGHEAANGDVWVQVPYIYGVWICLSPAEDIATDTMQRTSNIAYMAGNLEQLVQLRVEIVDLISIPLGVDPDDRWVIFAHGEVYGKVVVRRRTSGGGDETELPAQKAMGTPVGLLTFDGAIGSRAAPYTKPRGQGAANCTWSGGFHECGCYG